MARPSEFSDEIFERICEEIATSDKGLFRICDGEDDFPTSRTFYKWIARDEELNQRYARAKEMQQDYLVDQAREIADDSTNDTKLIGRDGEEREVCNSEWVQRSKLRVDVRHWSAARLSIKYREKQQIEQTNVHKFESQSDEELEARLAELRAKQDDEPNT